MENSTSEPKDHPLSEKQTNTDDKKLQTTTAAVLDPNFPLPELDSSASTFRHVKSFAVLAVLLAAGVAGAWFMGASILISEDPTMQVALLVGAFVVLLTALFLTGTVWVDWWELVLGYWWLSIPIGAAAGLVVVLNQESATSLKDVD